MPHSPLVNMEDRRLCRIVNTSRKLNGLIAYAPYSGKSVNKLRRQVKVQVEGQPHLASVKYANLVFLPDDVNTLEGGIAVDRRPSGGHVITAFQDGGKSFFQQALWGRSERSTGNLLAVQAHLEAQNNRNIGKRDKSGILLLCTDLNVSIAINRVASAGTNNCKQEGDTHLSPASKQDFVLDSIKALIRRFKKQSRQRRNIYAVFQPPLLTPDGYHRSATSTSSTKNWGKARVTAVLAGFFKIYPCPHAYYRDALEVRFVVDRSKSVVVRHEMYLDYGPEEAETYVMNAMALDDVDRLFPATLAKVDPQAFWSAVLHIENFLDILAACLADKTELCSQWNQIYYGVKMNQLRWQVEAWASAELPPAVIRGDSITDWCIDGSNQEQIAYECAHTALLMMLEAASVAETELGRKSVEVQLMDCYHGLEIGRFVSALNVLYRMERHHTTKKGGLVLLQESDHAYFLQKALEEAGYSSDDVNYLTLCGHCGSSHGNEAQKVCSKCCGVAYCNRVCQIANWKKHKEDCNPIATLTKRTVCRLAKKQGLLLTASPNPKHPLPTQPIPPISEASGTGSVSISKLPAQEGSVLSFSAASSTKPQMIIKFRHVSDLEDPITRLLLACGPLPDLAIAQSCVEECLQVTAGDLSKLRMPQVQWTPLEWAAKLGNEAIVDWLCHDHRLQGLLHIGCPVGWACQSGHIVLARFLRDCGADPCKTDPVLFGCTPPLLVAAKGGQWWAMRFLVDECGIPLVAPDGDGRNVLDYVMMNPNWKVLGGHRAAHDWANLRMRNSAGLHFSTVASTCIESIVRET